MKNIPYLPPTETEWKEAIDKINSLCDDRLLLHTKLSEICDWMGDADPDMWADGIAEIEEVLEATKPEAST